MSNTHSRRSLMTAATALGTLAAADALAASKKPHAGHATMAHGSMDHSQMNHGAPEVNFKLTRNEERVVRAIGNCVSAGEVCLSLCIETLAAGDNGMAACARTARAMLAICRAGQVLVQGHSTFAGQQLALCRAACSACQAECARHKSHHEACRACDEACTETMAAIDRLLG